MFVGFLHMWVNQLSTGFQVEFLVMTKISQWNYIMLSFSVRLGEKKKLIEYNDAISGT